MSNVLAIATVTATLAHIIDEAMQSVPRLSAAPHVKTNRPERNEPGFAGAHLFLYRVAPHAAMRNDDLSTRRHDGTFTQRPRAALELDYQVSFYGDDTRFESQRLMGAVVGALHASPVLAPEKIQRTVETGGADGVLEGSDLSRQLERIRVTPIALSLEELTRVWSVLYQVPYALSLQYRASAVLIEQAVPVVNVPAVHAPRIHSGPLETTE